MYHTAQRVSDMQPLSQRRQLIVVYKIINGLEQEPVEGVLTPWVTYSGPILRMLIVTPQRWPLLYRHSCGWGKNSQPVSY